MPKPTPRAFAEVLADNEETMPEMAAMAVTCEVFGITEEEGYDLLIADHGGDED